MKWATLAKLTQFSENAIILHIWVICNLVIEGERMYNIVLPMRLGLIVWNELEERGIKKRINPKNGLLSFDFSQEELDSIRELNLVDLAPGNLKGISNLKNLKSLSIGRSAIKIKGQTLKNGVYFMKDHYTLQRNIPSISDKDIIEIEKIESLESLSLLGQSKITEIDVSRLTKLKNLNIDGNMRLESICGLDNLTFLESLTLIANHELENAEGLNECLNNGQIDTISLDPQLFPIAINYNHRTGTEDIRLIEKMKAGDINVDFFETMTSENSIKMNLLQLLMVHNKSKKIVRFIDEMHPSTRARIMFTQAYLGDMVRYDGESLNKNHTHSEDNITRGPIHGANGIFNCLYLNTCVCEGYVRGAKYLLGLQGIKSRQVRCIAGKDNGNFSNAEKDKYSFGLDLPDDGYHSILLVQDSSSNVYGYCDPCWNATYYKKRGTMPFMLMSSEEIKETHTLSLEEQDISIMGNLYYRKVLTEETRIAIQKYEKCKREKMIKSSRVSKDKKTDEVEI